MQHIHIIGGDQRQIFLSDMLIHKGYEVTLTGFEQLGIPGSKPDRADYVFLPVPHKDKEGHIKAPYANRKLGLKEIVAAYPKSVYVMGRCDAAAKQMFGDKIRYIDLLQDEPFLIDNAELTSEGAICAYLNASDTALCGAKCVVIGFGRIGKLLCTQLRAYTHDIIATARKEKDLALIRAAQLRALQTKDVKEVLAEADVVFNTVPYHVLGKEELLLIRNDATVIELASPPYGMDIELAKQMGVNVRIEGGLPGRYFPASAARAMLHAFEREEKG